MTFSPVLPLYILAILAVVIVVVRIATLYRQLAGAAVGHYLQVVLRWSGVTLAALLLVLAAFRPGTDDGAGRPASASAGDTVSDINVFLVVDRSVTTRTGDFGDGQPRMVGIRDDIAALIDEYRGARYDLIGFATDATVDWPLSQDEWSFRAYVKNLSSYSLTPTDALDFIDPYAAGDILAEQLQRAKDIYPDSKNVVFYLGDGAIGSQVQPGRFDVPESLIAGGAVLGYGTSAGGPIPHSFSDGRKLYFADAATSAAANSSLDETRLQEIAESLGLPYHHREAGQDISSVLPPVNEALMSDTVGVGDSDPLVGRTDWYWIFALAAAGLLLVEMVLILREFRRNRLSRSDFTDQVTMR